MVIEKIIFTYYCLFYFDKSFILPIQLTIQLTTINSSLPYKKTKPQTQNYSGTFTQLQN